MPWLAVLVPSDGPPPGDPERSPLGRAALGLGRRGVRVVFGDDADAGTVRGLTPTRGGWVATGRVAVAAAFDRFPGQGRPHDWARLCEGLAGVPIGNPPALDTLCRDKLRCHQATADLGLPELECDPARFTAALERWGAAFLKPRFGSFGHGVRRVVPGDLLPDRVPGLTGAAEPTILQRAVPPPDGYQGVCVRVLVQRERDGTWAATEPAARWSRTDPVVSAARGAQVSPLRAMFPGSTDAVRAAAEQVATRLGGDDAAVELGVDLVLDPDGAPSVIEVNGKPRGRLEALATADPRWRADHDAAAARPLEWLAWRFDGDPR